MPKNLSATEWQYEPSFGRNSGSMSRVQTSFDVNPRHAALPHNVGGPPPGPNRTGSLKKALTTSDEDDEVDSEETRPLQRLPKPQVKPNNSHSSTSDYHSDENPNLLPVEHRELPGFRLQHFNNRHRKSDDEEMSGGARCCFGFLTFLAQILLHGVVGLVLFWVTAYHSKDKVPFSWRTDPDLEWNLHPVLMILGFIYFMGQAMLMYRTCRCCRRIWSKLLHTIFHLLAAPCIALGFVATWDYHNLRTDNDGNPNPIPNFYSLHSWMGLTTMGLFALQFIVGFFSFLLLLCCESATASFRAALVPIHSTFGITTFVMAVATSCTGLIEKAFFTLSIAYYKWVPYFMDPNYNRTQALRPTGEKITYDVFSSVPDFVSESLVVNCLGAAMVALVVIMPILVLHPKFRSRPQRIITVTHDRYG